jgi:hypothetical protein
MVRSITFLWTYQAWSKAMDLPPLLPRLRRWGRWSRRSPLTGCNEMSQSPQPAFTTVERAGPLNRRARSVRAPSRREPKGADCTETGIRVVTWTDVDIG